MDSITPATVNQLILSIINRIIYFGFMDKHSFRSMMRKVKYAKDYFFKTTYPTIYFQNHNRIKRDSTQMLPSSFTSFLE